MDICLSSIVLLINGIHNLDYNNIAISDTYTETKTTVAELKSDDLSSFQYFEG